MTNIYVKGHFLPQIASKHIHTHLADPLHYLDHKQVGKYS